MKNKKSVMGLAALLILLFHFYIPFSGKAVEMSIQKAAYVGVDIFFLLSAVSLSKKEKIEYFPFVLNRLKSIYLPFVIFSLIAFFYKNWKVLKLLKVVSGVELFEKGGGAFLWFAPGIMLIYLIAPLLVWLKKKYDLAALGIMVIVWLFIEAVLQYFVGYTTIFILLNRLPVFFAGLYFEEIKKLVSMKLGRLFVAVLFVLSILLLYKYGALIKLNKPFQDFYYVVALPFAVILSIIWDGISGKCKPINVPFSFVGRFTFELYCLQMIFGYDIEGAVIKKIGNTPAAFPITVAILLVISGLFYYLKICSFRLFERRKEKKE